MKKILFISIFYLFVSSATAQQIDQLFINLPDQFMPLLTAQKRAGLMSRYTQMQSDTITNNFGGISKLTILDIENNYLKIELTKQSSFTMKLWEKDDGVYYLGYTQTVCGPICSSRVAFFNTAFVRLADDAESVLFPDIATSDFLDIEKIKQSGENIDDIIRKYDVLFCTIEFSSMTDNIIVQSNAKEYLPEEVYKEIEPYLLGDKLEFIWENGKFRKGDVIW